MIHQKIWIHLHSNYYGWMILLNSGLLNHLSYVSLLNFGLQNFLNFGSLLNFG